MKTKKTRWTSFKARTVGVLMRPSLPTFTHSRSSSDPRPIETPVELSRSFLVCHSLAALSMSLPYISIILWTASGVPSAWQSLQVQQDTCEQGLEKNATFSNSQHFSQTSSFFEAVIRKNLTDASYKEKVSHCYTSENELLSIKFKWFWILNAENR